MLSKTPIEERADKRRMVVEKVVLFFVRWSQVLLFVSALSIILECAYLVMHANSGVPREQAPILYAVGIPSVTVFLLCVAVLWCELCVDRSSRKREKPGAGTPSNSKTKNLLVLF